MPKIREYNPTLPKVSPNDRALQAWETAGRRVGPLYNQAAQDIKEGGRVKGDMERAKIWPFDIYALQASNAPHVTNSTSNTTSIVGDKTSGVNIRTGGATREDYDWARPPVSPAQPTSGDADSDTNDAWGMAHGEASAGAVGMSRLARAAAQGEDLTQTDGAVLRGGRGSGAGVNPNSDLPVDWKTDPNTNGQNVIDTPNGQFTPHQMDRFTDKYNKAWEQGIEKWNREQDAQARREDAQYRQEQSYWNGPQGWNTRRDQWINGKDGIEDQWQKGYDKDMNSQAEYQARQFKKANPDDARSIEELTPMYRDQMRTTPAVQSNYGSYQGPSFWSQAGDTVSGIFHPQNVIGTIKDTFGAMFGNNDEPAAEADIPAAGPDGYGPDGYIYHDGR